MLGTFGSGGLLLIAITALILYRRGGGRLQPVKKHTVFYWAAAAGLLTASAGKAVQSVGAVGITFNHIITAQSGTFGAIGPAAVAALLILLAFGTDPHFGKDLILGLASPAVLTLAGSPWSFPVDFCSGLIHTVA